MKRKVLAAIMTAAILMGSLTGCTTSAPGAGGEGTAGEENTAADESAAPVEDSASGDAAEQDETSQTHADGSGISIQFWNAFTGSDGDVLREIVNKFNEENEDGITIEMDIMPGATLAEKLASSITTGTAPALVLQGNMDVALYGGNGSILPLDDFFEVTGTDKNDFEQSALDSFVIDGHQYMIPMQWFTQYLYYNKDLFEEAGIEKAPETWEELAQTAAKITNPDKNVFGVGFPVSGGVAWFDSMFLSNGGRIFSDDNTQSALVSDENLNTLKFVQSMVNDGVCTKGTTGADLDNLMMADQLGMVINGPWMVNGLKENEINFGVAPIPGGQAGQVGIAEVTGFAVPKGTSDEAKAAAYKFIAYWNTTEISKEWSMRNGFPPYLKSAAADPEIQENEMVKAFSVIADYGVPFGTGLKSAATINSDILFPMVENVIAGSDPAAELQQASDKIDEMLSAE